jgi:hypothetical protein
MITNITLDSKNMIEPEDMSFDWKLVVLEDGSTKMVNMKENIE